MRAATHAVLDTAYAAGIRWIDVARSYGRAEEFLAGWLDDRGHDDLTVSSKWGYAYVGDWRMDADVHDALAGSGVRAGFSTSGPAQPDTIRRALELERHGVAVFTAVQSTWNLLEPSAGAALSEAHAAGRTVLVKESLANGRLAVDPPVQLARLAEALGTGADAVALAAVLTQPWADVVLTGPSSPGQLTANLAATEVRLDAGELDGLLATAEDPAAYWQRRSGLAWQ
jgi:aryl-alcohol dehydrogenase-like predicted oxidoreductase